MLNSNHGDDCSFSGSSFPSLKLMHSREDENIIDGTTTISGEIDSIFTHTYNTIDACGMVRHADIQNSSDGSDDEDCDDDPGEDCYTLDGYPTDERTVQSFYQSKEKERLRLNILQVARNNLATKNTTEILGDEKNSDDSYFGAIVDAEHIKKGHVVTFDGDPNVDDSSFLANVDVEDAATKPPPDYSNQYVFGFSFLTTKNGEIVEEEPDDSSFIVAAGVDDVPDDFQSIGQSRAGTAVDSLYDVHASTLSRASAPDKILTGSNIRNNVGIKWSWNSKTADKDEVDEDQSASAYSYGRAYVDTDHASTLSALTGETLFFALRTGMSEAIIKPSPIQEDPSFESGETSENSKPSRGGEIKRFNSAPVDADTGALFLQCDKSLDFESGETSENSKPSRGGEIKKFQSAPVDADTGALFLQCDESLESLPRPPPLFLSDQATDFLTYENPDHLKMMLSYGEGGYVDEEAARIFTGSDRPNGANRNSCWLTSSSRTVKLCVMFSIILMIISVTSLGLAFLLPEQLIFTGRDEQVQHGHISSGHTDVEASTSASTNSSKSDAGTVTLLDDCGNGATCSIEGSRCTDGTTESCCGDAFYSFVCDCANVNGKLQYNICIFTNACLAPSCNNFEASLSSNLANASTDMPSGFPSHGPSNRPTQQPSADPAPAIRPTMRPTLLPTELSTISNAITTEPTSFRLLSNTPTQAEPVAQVTLTATKDTCINDEFPYRNYGTSEELRVDNWPKSWSFLTFDGSSVISSIARQTLQVLQATLRLYSLDEGGNASFFALPNLKEWSETSLTWNNEDQIDRSGEYQVGSLDWAEQFLWSEIDVTTAFANGFGTDFLTSFVIVSESTNGVTFASREKDSGLFSPELVLSIG